MSGNARSPKLTGTGIIQVSASPFSAISPYLITCPPYGDDPVIPDIDRYRNDCSGYSTSYLQAPNWHSAPDKLASLVRKELQAIYFEETAQYLRSVEP